MRVLDVNHKFVTKINITYNFAKYMQRYCRFMQMEVNENSEIIIFISYAGDENTKHNNKKGY